jgi:hypothetical protein
MDREVCSEASQVSDVGSIPIARSINPDDSVDLTRLSYLNSSKNRLVLDGSWTALMSIGRKYFAIPLATGGSSIGSLFSKSHRLGTHDQLQGGSAGDDDGLASDPQELLLLEVDEDPRQCFASHTNDLRNPFVRQR